MVDPRCFVKVRRFKTSATPRVPTEFLKKYYYQKSRFTTFFFNIFLSESPLKKPGGVSKEKCAISMEENNLPVLTAFKNEIFVIGLTVAHL